jgi:hypothetical protein
MLRELFIPISEALFWFTNGELLINTLWVFPWVFFWSLITVLPIIYAIYYKRNDSMPSWPGLVFIIGFFPGLLVAIGPGIVQMSLIEECRTVSAEVTIEGATETQKIRQCRMKENFYDAEYGPWKQTKG